MGIDAQMDNMKISLAGVFPPVPTSFDADGDLALSAMVENLSRWNDYDLAGYVVLGSNGEGVYLATEEKVQVWETVRQAVPDDRLFIAGAGAESTRQTVALSRLAADAGADAVLILTPHYYGGQMTSAALERHYETVAERVPVPVLVYNMPRLTHVDMTADTIARIGRHPNVIGLKDSSGNVGKLAAIAGALGHGFQILAGSASFFYPALTVGAVGGVMALANIAPQPLIDLYGHYRAGRWREATRLQQRLVPANTAVTSGFGVPGLKVALDMLGYYGGPTRSPLQPLEGPGVQALRRVLAEADLL